MSTDVWKRVHEIVERSTPDDWASTAFDLAIVVLIFVNVAMVILESFSGLRVQFELAFRAVEIGSVTVFTIEYGLRLCTARYKYPQLGFLRATLTYAVSFMAIVDLAAILPFYLPFVFAADLRFLRILRLIRLVRVLKIGRYTESFDMIGRVLKDKKEELSVTVFVTFMLLLFASSVMYFVETDVQPDAFPNVVAAFWWAIATLTTVGYGDVYPVTALGKILSGLIAVLGIGLVALPTGIISSGFIEEVQMKKRDPNGRTRYCPHCGARLDE